MLFLLLLSAGLWACTGGQSAPDQTPPPPPAPTASALSAHFDPAWAAAAHWDDGLAEVATYDAVRVIYGKPRTFEYTFALVKEAFNAAYRVKTDDYQRDDLYDVLKLNMFARIPTDNYPYHFLTSVFVLRSDATRLHKLTTSSQEWCGNTFKEFLREGEGLRYTWHSYWDGQGDGSSTLGGDVLFEDQLPLTLRSLRFAEGLRFEHALLPSEISSRAYPPQPIQAEFVVSADPVGEVAAWRVDVRAAAQRSSYWFDSNFPHAMLRMERSDGSSAVLKDLRRWAYW
ncbi:MAG: hypothetical protein OHK0039_48920 [Bacteroidia bacterium]